MGDSDWSTATDLVLDSEMAIVVKNIKSYNFFQLVELLHKLEGNSPEDHSWEKQGKLFFTANTSLGFAASDVTAMHRHHSNKVQLETTFLGLNGAQSPLPSYLLEQVIHDDTNIRRDFLDFFSNRVIALFYRAWRKYRYYIRFQDGAVDKFSSQVFALVGLSNENIRDDSALNWCKMLAYAGTLAGRSRSPQTVSGIVSHCFELEDVSIRQWEFRHVDIPNSQRCALGLCNVSLGDNWVLGSQVGDISGKFVLCINKLSLSRFQDFLPSGKEFNALCKVMDVILREQMAFDLELTVNEDEVLPSRMDKTQGMQLGWSLFLGNIDLKNHKTVIQIR